MRRARTIIELLAFTALPLAGCADLARPCSAASILLAGWGGCAVHGLTVGAEAYAQNICGPDRDRSKDDEQRRVWCEKAGRPLADREHPETPAR